MKDIFFSVIIPTINQGSEKLKDLIYSIKKQDFDQDRIEILIITEGTAETGKAIGIKRARGEICVMLCDDNYLVDQKIFTRIYNLYQHIELNDVPFYSQRYAYVENDNPLNRYFSLIGNNDPVAFYLGKCERRPYYEKSRTSLMQFKDEIPTLGENGFFYPRELLLKTDLENYSHIDNAEDLRKLGYYTYGRLDSPYIWHRTADSLISILRKRYRYAKDLYCKDSKRRWKMLASGKDYLRLGWFIVATLTVIQPLLISLFGFSKKKDWAWFLHLPVCFAFLIMYGVLAIKWKLRVL